MNIYYWGGSEKTTWPGVAMTYVEKNSYGQDIYCYTIPSDTTGIIFNNGTEQTVDITENITDGKGFYLVDNSTGQWTVETYDYVPTKPVETTTAAPTTTEKVTTTTAEPTTEIPTTTVEATEPLPETETVKFEYKNSSFIDNIFGYKVFLYDYEAQKAYAGTKSSNTWSFEIPYGLLSVNFYKTSSSVTESSFKTSNVSDSWTTGVPQRISVKQNVYTTNGSNKGSWNTVYTVSWTTSDVYSVKAKTPTVLLPNETFSFTVNVAEGYTLDAVTANGTSLTPSNGVYSFSTTADTTIAVVTSQSNLLPYYIRGDFNNWSTENEMTDAGNGIFTAQLTLDAGTYEYKAANEGYTMEWPLGTNQTITLQKKSVVTFTLDTNNHTLTASDEPVMVYYTVEFKNYDGSVIATQTVAEGEAATPPPIMPERESDAQYTYTFSGWDTDFSSVTDNLVITALYDKTLNKYTVTFVDADGKVLDTQSVEYGKSAQAPSAPTKEGYEFTGWSVSFDKITADTTVTAQYRKLEAEVATGTLRVVVTGGTSFAISINGGAERPQGAVYLNTKLPVGAYVKLRAAELNTAKFAGWVNPANGQILSSELEYTFYAGGNDYIEAKYMTKVAGVNSVTFKNDKSNQIIDMQYYAFGDEITFPEDTNYVGYDFVGWNMTAEEISAELKAGNDVVVTPLWQVKQVYVSVAVQGGEVIGHGGMNSSGEYLANRSVIVEADEPKAGMKFAYWIDADGRIKSYDSQYTFYPATDVSLKAVYVAENEKIDYQVLVYMDSCDTSGTYGTFNFSWYVPEAEGITFMAAGLVAVNKANYNESTFVHGTSDTNVWDRAATGAESSGLYNWTGPVMSGQTWVAKAWVQYKVAEGNVQTVYSTLLEVVKY